MSLYFIGTLEERNGEYEYQIPVRFTAASQGEAEKVLAEAARSWYGEFSQEDGDCYYFHSGEVCVCAGHYKEISTATYNEIAGYVTEAAAI